MLIVKSNDKDELVINKEKFLIGTKKENNERGSGEDQKADLL